MPHDNQVGFVDGFVMPDWLSLARWVPALSLSLGFSALCLDTDIIRLVLIEERVMVPLYAFLLNSKSMGDFYYI